MLVLHKASMYSEERLSKSIHLLSISPFDRTYSRVIPGGKYLSNIFLSFIFKNNSMERLSG